PLNRAVQPDTQTWVLLRNPGRGASVLVVVCWAALGAALTFGPRGIARWAIAAALAAGIGGLAGQFDQQANFVAFGVGLIAVGLGYAAPRIAITTVCALLALWIPIAPFAS